MVSGSNPLAASSLLDNVRETIRRQALFRRGDRVLVAVSAGPDSTALWACLVALSAEWKLQLRALYINHGLRPAAAAREAGQVRRLGKQWGVPVTVVSGKVQRHRGESIESAARRIRYAAFQRMAKRYGCQRVALGHTQDDQAETVLLWILRGVGFTGLAGIPPVRREEKLWIVRPLLRVSRREIQDFLKGQGIRPRVDRSNFSRRYTRNRIRHDLLPQLEREYNPQLRPHLAALAELVRQELDWIEQETGSRLRSLSRVGPGLIGLDRIQLGQVHPALRRELLRLSVRRLQGHSRGFTQRHWTLLDRLASHGMRGALDLPHGLRAEVKKDSRLTLRRVTSSFLCK